MAGSEWAEQQWRRQRDPAAFRELVAQHAGMVQATCRRILGDAAEAEDVTQECFEALVKQPGASAAPIGAWLHGVATRRSLQRIRNAQRRRAREEAYAAMQADHQAPTWDDIYQHIDEAIAELPPELREPLVAHYLEGERHAAVARRLGLPRRTVSYRIQRGVEEVGKQLQRRNITIGAAALAGMLEAHAAEAAALSSALSATLGKLALTQSAAATGSASPALAAGTLAGAIVMKKTALIIVAALAVLAAGLLLRPDAADPAPVAQADTSRVAETVPPQEQRGDAEAPTAPEDTLDVDLAALLLGDEASAGDDSSEDAGSSVENADAYLEWPAHVTPAGEGLHGRVSGVVVMEETKEPVPGFKMRLQHYVGVSPYGGMNLLGWVETNGEGRFGFDAREATHYWLLPTDNRLALAKPQQATIHLRNEGEIRDDVVLELTEGGVVEGLVYDRQTGRGIADVEVVWAGGRRSVTTGEDGRYRVSGLSSGNVSFALNNTGEYFNDAPRGSGHNPNVDVTVGETATLDFPLEKGVVLRGKVVDVAQAPIENAHVSLSDAHAILEAGVQGDFDLFRSGTTTDAEGRFIIPAKPGRDLLHLGIGAPPEDDGKGYIGHGEDFDVRRWKGERTFVLKSGNVIEGVVYEAETGAPLPAFEVAALPGEHPAEMAGRATYEAFQDPSGAFILNGIQSGPTTLFARAEGYATARQVVTASGSGEVLEVEVPMVRSVLIRGVITDEQGTPVPDSGVFIDTMPDNSRQSETYAPIKADIEGRFTVDTLKPGTYTLHGVKDGYLPGSTQVELKRNERVDATIVLRTGGVLTGTVTMDGEPLEGVTVNARAEPKDGTAVSDAGGKYRISGLPGGLTSVTAQYQPATGDPTFAVENAEIRPGYETVVDFTFTAATAAVEGDILLNGQLFEGSVFVVGHDADTSHAAAVATTRAKGGYYLLENVPAGEIDMVVSFEDGPFKDRVVRQRISAAAGKVTRCDFSIDLNTGVALRGQAEGFIPENSRYIVFPGTIHPQRREDYEALMLDPLMMPVAHGQEVAADGSFHLPALQPGEYTLVMEGPTHTGEAGWAVEHFTIGDEDVALNVAPQ